MVAGRGWQKCPSHSPSQEQGRPGGTARRIGPGPGQAGTPAWKGSAVPMVWQGSGVLEYGPAAALLELVGIPAGRLKWSPGPWAGQGRAWGLPLWPTPVLRAQRALSAAGQSRTLLSYYFF